MEIFRQKIKSLKSTRIIIYFVLENPKIQNKNRKFMFILLIVKSYHIFINLVAVILSSHANTQNHH